jgi:hypothetical protein
MMTKVYRSLLDTAPRSDTAPEHLNASGGLNLLVLRGSIGLFLMLLQDLEA